MIAQFTFTLLDYSWGFCDDRKVPWELATNRGKVIVLRDANPWLQDTSWKVVGSNPGAKEEFVLQKLSEVNLFKLLKCELYNLLIVSGV